MNVGYLHDSGTVVAEVVQFGNDVVAVAKLPGTSYDAAPIMLYPDINTLSAGIVLPYALVWDHPWHPKAEVDQIVTVDPLGGVPLEFPVETPSTNET